MTVTPSACLTPRPAEATLPLQQIYVALKADRSSPLERKASYQLVQQQAGAGRQAGQAMNSAALYEALRLDPYAARYLLYDPALRAQLQAEMTVAKEKTFHLAEVIRREQWFVLLGDPGSGKSTLARWLALQLALAGKENHPTVEIPARHVNPGAEPEAMEQLGTARLPVLVKLADYAATRWPGGKDAQLTLDDYLTGYHQLTPRPNTLQIKALLDDYRRAGRVTFILDGLDEVTDLTQRQEIAAEIEKLIRRWGLDPAGRSPLDERYISPGPPNNPAAVSGNQVIVTSRIVGYHLRPLKETLPHFIIQPMDDTAVSRFCANWATATGMGDHTELLIAGVLKHPNPNVREQMARNPLLLTILAQTFRQDPAHGLPERRTELYYRAAKTVFAQRNDHWGRLLAEKDEARTRILFRVTAQLAFALHANPHYASALVGEQTIRAWLADTLSGEPALTAGRHPADLVDDFLRAAANLSGFFVARGEGVYGFLHRQFQEFFAAWYLVCHRPPTDDAATWPDFFDRLDDPNWREVLLLTAGLLAEAPVQDHAAANTLLKGVLSGPDPTGGLLPHNPFFVAAALAELARPAPDLVENLAATLITAYRRDDDNRFAAIKDRVKKRFAALPRQVDGQDPAGVALIAALTQAPPDEAGKLTRLAALELLDQNQWYTPLVLAAVIGAGRDFLEPAATPKVVLDRVYRANSALFDTPPVRRQLPLRRALQQNSALWDTLQQHPHWQAALQALYLTPVADPEPTAVIYDSALTAVLLPLLRPQPADRQTSLETVSQISAAGDIDTPIWRDAAVLRAWWGDTAYAQTLAAGADTPLRGVSALWAILALARALDLARARDLDRDLDLDRSQLDKIEQLIRRVQQLWPDKDDTGQAQLTGSLDTLAHLRRLLVNQPLVDFITTFHDASTPAPQGFTAWAAVPRPRLGMSHWPELQGLLAKDPAGAVRLLVRLVVNTPPSAGDKETLLAALREILSHPHPPVRQHGALLLAELGELPPANIPRLAACLADPVDLTRYRARRMINRSRSADDWGREVIEALATAGKTAEGAAERPARLAGIYFDWGLKAIEHTQPAWLEAWAESGEDGLLGRVHRLHAIARPAWLELLQNTPPALRVDVLNATGWQLRIKNTWDNESLPKLTAVLQAQIDHPDPAVRRAALAAVGHLPQPSAEFVAALLTRLPQTSGAELPMLAESLARLARWLDEAGRVPVETGLRQYLPHPGVAAAQVRLHLSQAREDFDSAAALAALGPVLSAVDVPLAVLLRAGTDDDGWSDYYHGRVAQLVTGWAQQRDETILADLLDHLQTALNGQPWEPKRMALAAVAACAAAMPDTFALVYHRPDLGWPQTEVESLLLDGLQDFGSHNSRRFAITALSHLRTLTPAVLVALLDASRDVSVVQKDAVDAAGRFRHLSPDFQRDDAFAPFIAALGGQSIAAAYVAAKLLGSLGSSAVNVEIPNLRRRIAGLLSEALRHPNAGEIVYLFEDEGIKEHGSLAQTLWTELGRVSGLGD